ncbi:inositol polyphosphate multikinase, variant 2 [Dionaea muscipula]
MHGKSVKFCEIFGVGGEQIVAQDSSSTIMLKVPDHQVAGHRAVNGQLGPLIDESGRFYKPLQNDGRGSKEVEFYELFSLDTRIPSCIKRFFPSFYGMQLIEASDGSGLHPHLILEDIVSNYGKPSIMDIKIGSRTWYPEASEDYIQKCLKKDRESTSVSLGFRISGLQVYQGPESGFWKPDKKRIKRFSIDDARLALRNFVSSQVVVEADGQPDHAFASCIYGGSCGILEQLLELKSWFEDQELHHFNSCSILLVYDKELALEGHDSGAAVRLIDFAHVVPGNGVIDHNFLGGLCSLVKFISETLAHCSR